MPRPWEDEPCRSSSAASAAGWCSSEPTARRWASSGLEAENHLNTRFARSLAFGAASGAVAALLAEAVRPRGGQVELLDWDDIAALAHRRLRARPLGAARLSAVAAGYNRLADEVRDPLLEAVGGLPPGSRLPDFEALDRSAWLDLNVGILRRAMEPLNEVGRVPNSWMADLGRAGINRYVALLLDFLSRRVLGQFDPQLLGKEPVEQALYLVEPNVADWERRESLPGDDLRRWLILHEMTHAWQFAAHPWLREHLNEGLEQMIATATAPRRGVGRLMAFTVGGRGQWSSLRRMQATMTLVEGYGNLIMNLVGSRILPSFGALEEAYRRRSGQRSPLDLLIWRLTGLELKLRQYRVGEAFARSVYDRYGMEVLNRAWESPESLPRPDELRDFERWYRRIHGGTRTVPPRAPSDAG
jgi:coenzyme F420 biosynthesis associated uncharacterized protein